MKDVTLVPTRFLGGMLSLVLALIFFQCSSILCAEKLPADNWPSLRTYESEHLGQIAMPLGGVGTGCIKLGGRGDLRDWEIVNHASKGEDFFPKHSFFAIYARPQGGEATTRLLEGPVSPPFEDLMGYPFYFYGMPRFRKAVFKTAYPMGQILLSDPDVPVRVRLEAFNPLIPGDSDRSGIPVAILRYRVSNTLERPVDISIVGNIFNFIGSSHNKNKAPKETENTLKESSDQKLRGVFMSNPSLPDNHPEQGTLSLAVLDDKGVFRSPGWTGWNPMEIECFWNDYSEDGFIAPRQANNRFGRQAIVGTQRELLPGESTAVTFLITWHFPNRYSWAGAGKDREWVGNYYTTQYENAWDVAEYVARYLDTLESDTLDFVRPFCKSDLPTAIKEASLFNLSTFSTQTCFRTEDGNFYGYEGSQTFFGSCSHVWAYEQALAFTFPELAQSMREVKFLHSTDAQGFMSFRTHLPLNRAKEYHSAAADGQMASLMQLYREWQISGDTKWLKKLWPKARKALEFAWIDGSWDADRDGVIEGAQHNTTDLNFFGPNPMMQTWYLGALRAMEKMGYAVGEDAFAQTCHSLFEQGRNWMQEHLFNGSYYIQKLDPEGIETPESMNDIVDGLTHNNEYSPEDLDHPRQQIEKGCWSDQLIGEWMSSLIGLGKMLEEDQVNSSLRSILHHNLREQMFDNVCPGRAFAVNGESALIYGTYPGQEPEYPCFRFGEVWNGVEYQVAGNLILHGMRKEGLNLIRAIRQRYDGYKRNPFSEVEAGNHYARSLASWGTLNAWSGFQYSGVEQRMTFDPVEGKHFWCIGPSWGLCEIKSNEKGYQIGLQCWGEPLRLSEFMLSDFGIKAFDSPLLLEEGKTISWQIKRY